MIQHEHDVQPAALGDNLALPTVPALPRQGIFQDFVRFLRKTWVITEWEARKIAHDPSDIITRAVQPTLWLLVFGQVFTRIRAIPTGHQSYLAFLTPGILAQSILFQAIFYGITIIWERDLGLTAKFLATPTPRASLVLGKALSAGVRALPQAVIIYILALLLGVQMNWNPLALIGVLLLVMLGACCFACFSVLVASLLRTRERVMGIGQVMTMPLFFASNAIYNIDLMPNWLKVLAHLNPLSYLVGAFRMLMVTGGTFDAGQLALDIGVLLIVTTLLVSISTIIYPKVVQ